MTATVSRTIEVVPAASETDRVAGVTPDGGDPPDRDTFHVTFDPDREDVEGVVVEAVAAIHTTDPARLDLLANTVDADAPSALVSRESTTEEITFTYEELEITLDPAGDLWLTWT